MRRLPAWMALCAALAVAAACGRTKMEATPRSDEPTAAPTATAELAAETPSPPTPPPAGPSPSIRPTPSVTLEVSLYQSRGEDAVEKVSANQTFRSGDRIRFGVLASRDGRLVLVHKGSSGSMAAIYPDQRIAEGSNTIVGGSQLVIPQKGWFVFDEKPGTETVYAVFSEGEDAVVKRVEDAAFGPGRSKGAPDERLVSELDDLARGKPTDGPRTSIVRTIVLKHK